MTHNISKGQRITQGVLKVVGFGLVMVTFATGEWIYFTIGCICAMAGFDVREEDEI